MNEEEKYFRKWLPIAIAYALFCAISTLVIWDLIKPELLTTYSWQAVNLFFLPYVFFAGGISVLLFDVLRESYSAYEAMLDGK